MKSLHLFALILGATLCAASPSFAQNITVTVLDAQGSSVPGVFVLVGSKLDEPFKGNWVATDQAGQAVFAAPEIQNQAENLPITLVARGYPRITYFNQFGVDFILRLPPPSLAAKANISGDFVGWKLAVTRGDADFGLFLPFLPIERLFGFQMNDLISNEIDTFTVLGKPLTMPTNLVFPEQRQWYGIIPVTLNKPTFRLPLDAPSTYHFLAMAGQFPFSSVAKAMIDGKTILDVINEFKMQRFGILTNQNMATSITNVHMDINQSKVAPCVKASAGNIPAGLRTVSLALTRSQELFGRPYIPTDIKTLDGGPQNLGCIQGDKRPINTLAIALSSHIDAGGVTYFDHGMSSIIARNIPRTSDTPNVKLNSFFAAPQVAVQNEGNHVTATRPERAGISPTATAMYAVLSDVTQDVVAQTQTEEVIPRWIVFGNSQLTEFDLPILPDEASHISQASLSGVQSHILNATKVKRWEVMWLGLEPAMQHDLSLLGSVNLGYDLFENMTHAARNSADF